MIMCIIIAAPPGHNVSEEELQTAISQNRDGAGFVFAIRGQLVIDRDATKPDRIVEEWLRLRHEWPNVWGVFHARIGTQGSVCEANTHPFTVPGRDWALAHNGILDLADGPWSDRSDSRILAEDHVSLQTWRGMVASREQVEAWLGHSKVVILSAHRERGGRCLIFNERLGQYHSGNGCWYSHYQSRSYQVTGWGNAYDYDDDAWEYDWHKGARDYRHETAKETPALNAGDSKDVDGQDPGADPETGEILPDRDPALSDRRLRLVEAAEVLGIDVDDLEAWSQTHPDDVETVLEEVCEDVPDTIDGEWDDEHRIYYGKDGQVWVPDPANPDLIIPASCLPFEDETPATDEEWDASKWDNVCEWCGAETADCVCWNRSFHRMALLR